MTSPFSTRLVQTNFGTIFSTESAAKKGEEFLLKRIFRLHVLQRMPGQFPLRPELCHILSQKSYLSSTCTPFISSLQLHYPSFISLPNK